MSKTVYTLVGLRGIIEIRFSLCVSKGRSSLCISRVRSGLFILKNSILGLLMQTCFLHKFSLMTKFFIVEERLKEHQTIIKKI